MYDVSSMIAVTFDLTDKASYVFHFAGLVVERKMIYAFS
jgi:hypothetical protein